MGKTESWMVSDAFWEKVQPLIPSRVTRSQDKQYHRKPGGGRKPQDFRKVFSGIVFVLRTGIQWKALPKQEYGSPSSIHKYFRIWLDAGFFAALWRAGLAEYDEMEGIAWRWQSIDGCMVKAPLARESVGKNPTDRGKKWEQASPAGGRAWHPAVDRRNRGKSARRDASGSGS